MAPAVFETKQLEYVTKPLEDTVCIYGALKQLDGVTPYRLEMQAKAAIGDTKKLIRFLG